MQEGSDYDPYTFWNEKARAAAGDPLVAVCHSNPSENRNIDAVQRRLVGRALARVSREVSLSGRRLLDYGCGSGRWALFFRGLGAAYSGVDVSEEMVALALTRDPTGDYKVLDSGRIPHPDGAFAVLCSIAVLHHNPPDAQVRILGELLRVLEPDGHLVLFESVGEPDPSNPVEFARPADEWTALLATHGLHRTWYEGGRYFVLRTALEAPLARLGVRSGPEGWWGRRLADRLGSAADPYLGSLLPARLQRRAAMVFRRVSD